MQHARVGGHHPLGERVLVDGLVDQLGVDEAEIRDARARAVLDELRAQGAPELLDARLRDRIRRRPHAVAERVDRRDDDHVPAARHDVRQRRPHGTPDAEQVDVEDPLERVGVHRQRGRRAGGDARVRDDDVEAAEALDRGLDRFLDGLGVADVGLQSERARGVDPGGRLLGGLPAQIDNGHGGAARVQPSRRRQPDAARAAGDERDLVL